MSYQAAIDQLNAMVPELYAGAGMPRRKFSLNEIGTLLDALSNPHRRFPSLLIAGTNGKGSTAASLASILTASGVKTGLFTSPHLARVNERMRIDGIDIDDDEFANAYFRVRQAAQKLVVEGKLPQLPSFFEVLTAQAMLYFAESGVGLAVLEVGMGGRLDATNIVEPILSIVTDISLEHTEWLGPTVAAIAREKAGILRPGGTMITLPQLPEANQVLGEVATALKAEAVSAVPYVPPPGVTGAYDVQALGAVVRVDSPLKGAHQHRNLALAIAAAVELKARHGFPVTPETLALGLRKTQWPGRLERLNRGGVEWILDVAHNPAGVWALRSGLSEMLGEGSKRTLVFSCLRDKRLDQMSQVLFPLFDEVIVAPMHNPRAVSAEELKAAAEKVGVAVLAADSVPAALAAARVRAQGGAIVVSGSVYLVGEARTILLSGEERA